MSIALFLIMLAACAVLMAVEHNGARTTLGMKFRGDVQRETMFLAQWGQAVSTPLCALLIWQLDPSRRWPAVLLVVTVVATATVALILKRLLGRVRPNREGAGRFLGPAWRRASHRESFPSSHSACAMAASVFLAHLYPAAALIFLGLGVATAVLRYILEAHWPSDVLAGVALGYAMAWVGLRFV
jgi:membrane-associated phospholipid phosphatase